MVLRDNRWCCPPFLVFVLRFVNRASRTKRQRVTNDRAGCRHREATTGSRWQLGDHDVAGEVDAESLKRAAT